MTASNRRPHPVHHAHSIRPNTPSSKPKARQNNHSQPTTNDHRLQRWDMQSKTLKLQPNPENKHNTHF
ncbi:hypothetical protein RHMOL_Rhmol01G0174600 [Rhododendron molle]|uniref:Uncharacterized protein n=1 Tax=Rhododendron molle TaxID=49168 RepID=A0ACC0Q434_RHOML|nr:hypothetical protein RHMOL_Rhmol01G0174600 [Rhododendron molle]